MNIYKAENKGGGMLHVFKCCCCDFPRRLKCRWRAVQTVHSPPVALVGTAPHTDRVTVRIASLLACITRHHQFKADNIMTLRQKGWYLSPCWYRQLQNGFKPETVLDCFVIVIQIWSKVGCMLQCSTTLLNTAVLNAGLVFLSLWSGRYKVPLSTGPGTTISP